MRRLNVLPEARRIPSSIAALTSVPQQPDVSFSLTGQPHHAAKTNGSTPPLLTVIRFQHFLLPKVLDADYLSFALPLLTLTHLLAQYEL
jgi:hypothetical protein